METNSPIFKQPEHVFAFGFIAALYIVSSIIGLASAWLCKDIDQIENIVVWPVICTYILIISYACWKTFSDIKNHLQNKQEVAKGI